MNILILGPQGSGKGTQARRLAEKYGLNYVESGDILREAARSDPRINQIVNVEGRLLDDETTFDLVKKGLEEKAPGGDNLLLDGYPRSPKQYEMLGAWLSDKGQKIDLAILLEVGEEETVKRLSARRMDRETGKVYNLLTNPPGAEIEKGNLIQRTDDAPEAIKRRLEQYRETTKPLIGVFEKEGILRRVNGERPIDAIFADLVKIVSAHAE